jgi:CRP-like cAMP-binding protein
LRCIQIPGSYISLHMTFTETRRYSYYCEALNPSTCFSWDAEFFLRLARQEPSFGFHVAAAMSGYFEDSCRLNCICRNPQAASRVAGYLLHRCANRAKMSIDIRPVGLTAHDVCLRRETFSKVLASLKKKNIIRMQKGIVEILDIDELKKISGTD